MATGDAHVSTDQRVCRREGCGKPAAEGWMICSDHVEQRLRAKSCRHGNFKACIECLVESLQQDAVTTVHDVPENYLLAVTAQIDHHPVGWEWPCMRAVCRSYADG